MEGPGFDSRNRQIDPVVCIFCCRCFSFCIALVYAGGLYFSPIGNRRQPALPYISQWHDLTTLDFIPQSQRKLTNS